MKNFHLIVHGKVQGVAFRMYTKDQAEKLNIMGWVKNNLNGTVEIEAEGNNDAMTSFLDAIHEGSPYSKVEKVEVKEQNNLVGYTDFKITY